MRILLVEDDPLQAEQIAVELREALGADVDRIPTESEFRRRIGDIVARPPDVVVMDLLLRWTDPAPDMPEPPRDVGEGGFFRAGLRCQQMLSGRKETRAVPVILYTVLEKEDLEEELAHVPSNVVYCRKSAEGNLLELIGRVSGTAQGSR